MFPDYRDIAAQGVQGSRSHALIAALMGGAGARKLAGLIWGAFPEQPGDRKAR